MKKSKIVLLVLLIIIFGLIIFFAAPNLNPLYPDGLSFWAFTITIFVAVFWLSGSAGSLGRVARKYSSGSEDNVSNIHFKFGKKGRISIIIIAIPWLALILVSIFSSAIFHSAQYRDQIKTLSPKEFTSDVQPIDVKQLPIVDQSLAALLADKMLGSKPGLGSQVTLGDPTIQQVSGKLVWVVPLEDSGFFKWLNNMSGTPGYIIVSATDPNDVTYVNKYPIKYQPNAYFFDNLNRYARLSGGEFLGLTDYSFEIDDQGQPYWVITIYKNEVGFSLPEATGVMVINATTGQSEKYTISELAEKAPWVDRVQPADFITTQLNNHGQYIHGIFNFSNKDKFQTSQDYAIVYSKGRCYYFTGLTSVGSDNSATGFVMTNMVNKTTSLYLMSGATDNVAQQSAEGKVQNYGYTASVPLITNVDGQATYFMTLKDDSGLIKQYAFVSVKDVTNVGTGETINDALDDFRQSELNSGGSSVINTDNTKVTLEGTISRIASEQQGNTTVYEFILDVQPGTIFTATYDVSDELALTKEGDKVKITYTKPDSAAVTTSVDTFDNEGLGLK